MTRDEKIKIRSIHDLASARLRNPPLEANVEHDLREIVRIAEEMIATFDVVGPPPETGGASR